MAEDNNFSWNKLVLEKLAPEASYFRTVRALAGARQVLAAYSGTDVCMPRADA